jgi:hypothetical protein
MPTGTRESFAGVGRLPEGIIYPELVHGGMVETLVQNTDAFNAASLNTIRLVTNRSRGDFHQESFFKNVSSLINRRDVNASPANPAVSASAVPVSELISVKLNRRVGPIDQTYDSFRKLGDGADLEVLSFLLGEQIAKAMQVEMLDSGLNSIVAAITAQAALIHDGDVTTAGLDTADLVSGLSKFGDAANRVSMWVMHSKPFFELIQSQITANIDGISNFNVAQASPVTLNRPVLVTDSAALLDASVSPQQYVTLGLVDSAVVMEDSEEELMYTDVITGQENIVSRLQGEYAYNVGCKGSTWDVTNGGVNPNDAALGTSTNWDSVMDNVKDLGGVAIRSQF